MKGLLILSLLVQLSLTSFASDVIRIGSKNFNESYVLSEIVASLLESEGFDVERKFGLGGTLVCYQALLASEIDIYIEYTGTVQQAILKESKPDLSLDEMSVLLGEQISLLPPLGFNNTYAIAISREVAADLSITTISDLERFPLFKAGFSLEFLNREDGWPNLAKTYGLSQNVVGIEHGLAYQAIKNGSIKFTDAYSTDGDLKNFDLIILDDDKRFFPEYLAVPIVRTDLSAEAIAIVSQLEGKIDDKAMRSMNAKAVIERYSFDEIARDFLSNDDKTRKIDQSESFWQKLLKNTFTHIKLTSIALTAGIFFGLICGFFAYNRQRISGVVLYSSGLMQTVPSIALLALMIPIFGIGEVPAIVALFLYSILPIVRNTITGLRGIDPVLKKVVVSIGLDERQQMYRVLIPLAMPAILSGIKTAAVISIGTATLAAFIGAGGLGEPIVTGLALNDVNLILQGAIPAAILAILVEFLFSLLERLILKPHMRQGLTLN